MRRFLFRVLIAICLVLSPILFPAVLLISRQRVRRKTMRELYRDAWRALRRGFP